MSSQSGKRLQHCQRRRLERKNDVSSSSSVADDAETEELEQARQRSISASSSGNENVKLRRRKRKRRSSTNLTDSKNTKAALQKQKLFNIGQVSH